MLIGQKPFGLSSALNKTESVLDVPCILVILGVLYNTALALANANILAIRTQPVIITEALILLSSVGYLAMNTHRLPNITRHLSFMAIITCLSVIVILINGEFFIKFIRDMVIMVLFVLLGTLTDEKNIIRMFKFLAAITLFFAFIEIFWTDLYVSLFQPASYYQNTRGISPLGESGLFRGAVSSDSRFSFNFLSSHRISSIYLEQVSLANFSMILTVFIMSFWKSITRKESLFFIFTVVFLILSNDTRTGTGFVLLAIPGYFIFSRLPYRGNILLMPIILIAAAFCFYDPLIDLKHWSDDLPGRIGLSMYLLSEIDFLTAISGNLKDGIYTYVGDSGYTYLIYASTLPGAILYWIYTSFLVSSGQVGGKRFAYSSSLFIAVNLLISSAIFTIKIAGPLWIMGGFFFRQALLYQKEKNQQTIKHPCLMEAEGSIQQ